MHYAIIAMMHEKQLYTLTAASHPADADLLDTQLKTVVKTWKFKK
jgi:hypothetical protein